MKLPACLVLISAFVFAASEVALASNQSWSSRPSWASDREDSRPSRRPGRIASQIDHDIRPFTPGSHNLALDLGQVFLMGNLGSNYTDNIGTQIHYTYGVSDMFAFDSSFGFSSHGEGYSQTTLTAGMRTNLAWYDKVIPHLNFGLGFYKPSYEFQTSGGIESSSPVLFGLHLGPGVDLELTRSLFFGASLTFHDMFGKKKAFSTGQKDLGGTYTSFFLRAGVTF